MLMAKRFTDTGKWSKPFLRGLDAPYKLLWIYILDECDHAGIWQVDIEVARVKLGVKVTLEDALKNFEGKVYSISDGEKWFIPNFIEFQYGHLNPDNRAHQSVLKLLKSNNIDINDLSTLQGPNKGLTRGLQGAAIAPMDMDKDKDKDKDKEKENAKNEIPTEVKFLEYAKDNTPDFLLIQDALKLKYRSWVENNWRDGKDKAITNWKTKLLNTIPYLIPKQNQSNPKRYEPDPHPYLEIDFIAKAREAKRKSDGNGN